MIRAQGYNGTATLDNGMVTINRTGFAARVLIGSGSKAIPVHLITAVQFVPARAWAFRGFIQFTLSGGVEQTTTFGERTRAAHHDENTVVFNRHQQADFEQLRDAIQQVMTAVGAVS